MNDAKSSPDRRPRQGMDYGETEDVQQVHAAIQREKREPRVGLEPLSIWLIAVYGLAVFFGGAYLGRFSGNFTGEGLDPLGGAPRPGKTSGSGEGTEVVAQQGPFERGKKVYSANCATCHQANGLGVGNQYPPLAGSEWVTGGTKRLGMILLKGLEGPVTVKGQQYGTAVMQAWDKTLTDAKIADVMTYIRQEWGNNASPVAPEGVGALRKEIASRSALYRNEDLQAVPADEMLAGGEAPAGAPPAPGASPPAAGASPPPQP